MLRVANTKSRSVQRTESGHLQNGGNWDWIARLTRHCLSQAIPRRVDYVFRQVLVSYATAVYKYFYLHVSLNSDFPLIRHSRWSRCAWMRRLRLRGRLARFILHVREQQSLYRFVPG